MTHEPRARICHIFMPLRNSRVFDAASWSSSFIRLVIFFDQLSEVGRGGAGAGIKSELFIPSEIESMSNIRHYYIIGPP